MTLLIPFTKRKVFLKPETILLVLLAAGAFIRFFGLEYSSLWLDELYSMLGSDPGKTWTEVYEYSKNDQPPLFFFILHGWLKIFGNTDFAGRSLTCVFGLLGIVVMYFLGKEIKNEKLGILAAFITTINWFHTDISKEIRFYPLVFLLTACSFLFFLRCIKRTRAIDFVWGTGYGTFNYLKGQYGFKDLILIDAHNGYLNTLAQLGFSAVFFLYLIYLYPILNFKEVQDKTFLACLAFINLTMAICDLSNAGIYKSPAFALLAFNAVVMSMLKRQGTETEHTLPVK